MPIPLNEPAVRSAIRRATAERGRVEVIDAAAPGLRLRVAASGAAGWWLACRDRNGAMRRFRLGAWPEMGIAEARRAASSMREDVRRGADPVAEKRAAKAVAAIKAEEAKRTLGLLVDDWASDHLKNRSARYRGEAVRALKHAFAAQWDQPAMALDRLVVRSVLEALGKRRSKRGNVTDRSAMQTRTVAYGRACYGWALKHEYVQVNPFLMLPLPETAPARSRVLTDAELADVLAAAGRTDTFGRLVWLLATTGQRREEVSGLRWQEISRDGGTWTIPKSRTKNGAEQVVPLSTAAREGLTGLTRRPDLVFPSSSGKTFASWAKAKLRLDAAVAKARAERGSGKAVTMPAWRVHDLRRTMATGLQRLGVRLEVTEAVLNHRSGSRAGIVGVYQVHDWADEKREALERWGAHVLALLRPNLDYEIAARPLIDHVAESQVLRVNS